MELYDEIRNALKKRGCRWIEDHIFIFMGQRLHFDIHDFGQNYILKVVHRATAPSAADLSEPYIRKDFSLEKTVTKCPLHGKSLRKRCELIADGFMFWLESMCVSPAPLKEPVPVRSTTHKRLPQ